MYMLFQGRASDVAVFHEPELLFRVPFTTSRFDLCRQIQLIAFYLKRENTDLENIAAQAVPRLPSR
jgi:hypothetical protein